MILINLLTCTLYWHIPLMCSVVAGDCFQLRTTSSLGPQLTMPVLPPLLTPVMWPAAAAAQLWIPVIKKMNGSGFSGTISRCCLRCHRDLPSLLPATIATESRMSWLPRLTNTAFTELFKICSYQKWHSLVTVRCEHAVMNYICVMGGD